MNYWTTLYRVAIGLLAIVAVIVLVFLFLPKVDHFRRLQSKRIESRKQNEQKADDIQTLMTKQEKFRNDPAVVEKTARKIGMVKPKETIFRFTNEPSSDSTEKP